MIQQIEKVGPELQTLPLGEAESFAEREVYVFLRWPDYAVARSVAEAGYSGMTRSFA